MLALSVQMGDWKNEDEIKADLRAMTDELRRLREGLRNLVSPPPKNPARAFLHRQSWPTPVEHPPAVAAERKRPSRRKKPG